MRLPGGGFPMNDLEELKSLLFGAEKQVLDSITERVQKPETRAADIADVLPEAVRMSHQQGSELVATLRDPVGECIKDSFHNEPKEYADALYPVMGPAIRKSIISALRAFAQQINDTVEQSVSAKGIKWRFEAWRAGIPFGEYVVQRTLRYRIEQAYLISRDNGLLIGHAHHQASRIKDSDAVSAMFTAIQDFIKESFSPDRSGRLETADMGEFTLWAVHGPHALLVCVIRGVPPRSLRADLSAILERIHFRYGDAMREYSGDTTTMPGVEEDLAECLRFEALKSGNAQKPQSKFLYALLFIFAAVAGYLIFQSWQYGQQQRALATALDDTPGIYVAKIERDGRVFTVRGLRDPYADPLESVAARAELGADRVTGDLRPFQSLESDIVFRRAESLLGVPDTVAVSRADERLLLSGTASGAWLETTRQLAATGNLGVDLDLSGMRSSDLLRLQTDAAALGSSEFIFGDGATLRDADAMRMASHAASLGSLARTAQGLGVGYRIAVVGHTDAAGSLEINTALAVRRAGVAVAALKGQGIAAEAIEQSTDIYTGEYNAPKPELRRVSIAFELLNGEIAGPDYPE